MPRPGFNVCDPQRPREVFDTEFNFNGKDRRVVKGYYTTVVTDMAMDWIKDRESTNRGRSWWGTRLPRFYFPEKKYQHSFDSVDIQYPESAFNLDDKLPGSKSDSIPGTGSMGVIRRRKVSRRKSGGRQGFRKHGSCVLGHASFC